jgi:tryptophan-rich sensory protein
MSRIDNPDWYAQLKKSPLNPPSWVFGVVWPILYLTLAWSFARYYFRRPAGDMAWTWFVAQMLLNGLWTTIFFRLKEPTWALLCIVGMIVLTAWTGVLFYAIDQVSAFILIPYFVWLCFATYLNAYIVWNNP